METGYDILFFWVARMMMMGLHFMGDVPFRRVLLHGMVVDETGDKMGKLKGNTLDPLDLVHGAEFKAVVQKSMPDAPVEEALAKFKRAYPSVTQMGQGFAASGADSLRFTMCSYSPQAKRIALSPARVEGYRKFCNKIYNATRFSLSYLAETRIDGRPPEAKLLFNKWILSRLVSAVEASTRGIDEYRLDDGSSALYHFFWDEFCDWFVEMSKPIFANGSADEQSETRRTLAHVLETALRALHPYLPFVTEELWQRIPRPAGRPISIALAPYPTRTDGRIDADAEREMDLLMGAIVAARTVRSEHDIPPSTPVLLELRAGSAGVRESLLANSRFIEFLVRSEGAPRIAGPGGERPRGAVASSAGGIEVLVHLRGLVDPAKEKERIDRQLKKVDKDIDVMKKRLANSKFTESAPPEVVAEARAQLDTLSTKRQHLVDGEALIAELS
jgi:valyl-tRNA synthetase